MVGRVGQRLLLVLAVVGLLVAMAGCEKEEIGERASLGREYESLVVRREFESRGSNVMAVPTAQQTATPGLVIDNKAAGAVSLEVRDAGTPVYQVQNSGAVSHTGPETITGAWKLTGPTVATTATPVARIGNSADVNDNLSIEKDSTPVVQVGNAGLVDIGNGTGGTADGFGDLLVAGDAEVDDTLDVDGDIDLDGDGFDVDISAGWSIDGDAASNLTTNTGDLTIENEDKSIIIKADEAAADAIYLDANDAAGTGLTIVVGATGGVHIDGGLTDIGTGTCGVANGDNDLCVAGDAEIDGEAELDGALDADSTADIADTLTLSKGSGTALTVSAGGSVAVASGDVTISADSTNGNGGIRNEYIGLPRIRMKGLGQGTNGTTAPTLSLDDDTPSGEFVASDADVVVSDDATYYQEGAASLKIAISVAADEGDGAHDGVALDFTDDESIGFWFMADRTLAAGDLVLDLTDDGGTQKANLPAYATANTWVWVEIGLPAANGDKDVISDISFELSAAGALVAASGAFNVYIDAMYKWDAADEDAIGAAVLTHGILGVVDTETGDDLELYTEYFVHYESGNDFLVWITDESASDIVVLYAY